MKTQKINKLTKSILVGILATSVILIFTSCEKKVKFLNSSVVPAAKGTVTVNQDKNKNYVVKVKIVDLAEVERLQPEKQTYVVWMETESGNTENLGQLKSSASFFSKQKTASLETVSSYKPVRIFVTAEQDINVQTPDRKVYLTTDTF
ncbi:MAG: hypothetical protein K0B11_10885 [Mariniphaga sp.]|nr:hypothetical protein [Mariniphaga sp.]